MKPSAALANCTWLAACLPGFWRFRRAIERPELAQREVLRRLLADNMTSAYGRAHGFDGIRNYERFRELVPIVGYETLDPWIARIRRGEKSVLTREPATRLVPTAGSTGGLKLIPFTATLQREFNAAIDPWVLDLCRAYPTTVLGPAYWSISPAIPAAEALESAVPIGFDDDSAYLGGLRRRLVGATFAVPSALRLVGDIETFRYLTILCLLRQPELRLASVWHPSFFALLLDALPQWWEELVDDVSTGGCKRANALPAKLRSGLRAGPQPRRAGELRRLGPSGVPGLWPRLRVVSCWGDAQAVPAMEDLQRRLPRVTIQRKGLLATEAFVSLPFCGRHPVAVLSHFFEFADERGEVRLAHQLQLGQRYTVIVTTGGGLWRYRLGDLVEVDGFIAATPSLRFVGRGGSVVDLRGEKLAEGFVTEAISAACAAAGFVSAFAMLAPEQAAPERWNYTLFVEGTAPPGLAALLDEELRKNPHYALCRRLGQLGELRLCNLRVGAYAVFCRTGIEEGRSLGNIKPQSLSHRTDWRSRFSEARRKT